MEVYLYTWNNYLETQYIWDGTCGYHALKNTLNMMYILNDYHLTNDNYIIDDLLNNKNICNKLNNYKSSNISRNYYIMLSDGLKSTNVYDLKNISDHIDKNNNLYFWDIYEDRSNLIKIIKNNIIGVYGVIIYYEDLLCKHWYGCVIDIMKNKIVIHLLDSYSLIWPHTNKLYIDFLDHFNFQNNIIIEKSYSKLLIYSYKIYQLSIFIFVYFIIFYAIILLVIKFKKLFSNKLST